MKPRPRTQPQSPLVLAITASLLAATAAPADIIGPYTADAHTLHLWHLDEADPGPAASMGHGTTFALTPGGGAFLGAPAFTGFGTAADTTAATNAGLQGVMIPASNVTGADGAFTLEAMIRISDMNTIQQIIALDVAGGNPNRPFQFRIDAGQLRFINIAGSTVEQILALIPTTGPDAFVADEWFHAAVAYNGNENTADNIKLYWTRVDASRTQANEILSTTMLEDLAGAATFGAGNEYRAAADNNLLGQIDEVRISDIARGPGEFIFFDPNETIPPTLLGTTPADNATNVATTVNLVATFNEPIAAGAAGTITLKRTSDDSTVESFDVTSSSQLTIAGTSVTINPTDDLVAGIEYYVLIGPSAVDDLVGNDFAGITDPTAWSFTTDGTAPTGTAMGPMADATEVSPRSGLSLTFSENVQEGAGNITIHLAGDDSIVQTIAVTSDAVTIDGGEVTIDLSQLAELTAYYVNIPAGAFTDPSGNAFAGITDTTTWAFTTAEIPEGLLFVEDFTGTADDLDTTIPDTTIGGAAWVAAPIFNQDGSIDQAPGSATLAFTPFHGLVYTLEASITGISGTGNWFALGFANGQSNLSSANDRFITGNVVGAAWMLMKGDASTSQNSAFLGLGTLGAGNHGLTSNEGWTVWTTENPGGDIDMRIVLDTTGGPGTWTATWYAKRPDDRTYTEIRPTSAMLTESISAVGLAIANAGVFGTIESFRLYTGGPTSSGPLVLKISENGGLLDFAWNSTGGMQYDLVSSTDPATETDPALWAPYNDGVNPVYENIKAAGAVTTLADVAKAGTPRFFALIEEPIPPLLSESFDTTTAPALPAGWTSGFDASDTLMNTTWDLGAPADEVPSGPPAAFSDANCVGTNLAADYGVSSHTWLRTPPIDLGGLTGGTLSFRQWIDIDPFESLGISDRGTVRILDSETLVELAVLAPAINGLDPAGWVPFSAVLPLDVLGKSVVFEFGFVSDDDNAADQSGWYIDDVAVTAD